MDTRPKPTEAQARELDRVNAFSDGVFAFAITLLVVNLDVPASDDHLWDSLRELDGDLFAFLISFAVIGGFWYGHHKVFSLLDRSSGQLIFRNLVLLALIVLMPFTTDLLGTYGDQPVAVAVYAANLGLAAFADGLIEVLAARTGLAPEGALGEPRALLAGAAFRAAVFFVSIPIAFFVSIPLAEIFWISLLFTPKVYGLLGGRRSSPAS